MKSAKRADTPKHPIQSSGEPTEPSKSMSHLRLILSKAGYLMAAAGPSKRIRNGMACMVPCVLGVYPGVAKYNFECDIVV